MDLRLDKIEVVSGSIVQEYDIDYNEDVSDASVAWRIWRRADGQAKVLRWIEVDETREDFGEPEAVDLDSVDIGGLEFAVNARPYVVNFDGDAFPDLAEVVFEENPYARNVQDSAFPQVAYARLRANDGNGGLRPGGTDPMLDLLESDLSPGAPFILADFDRDGATDILASETYSGGETLFTAGALGLPTAASTALGDGADPATTIVLNAQAIDFDGDGFPDLVVTADGETSWIRNLGAAPWFQASDRLVLAMPLDPSDPAYAVPTSFEDVTGSHDCALDPGWTTLPAEAWSVPNPDLAAVSAFRDEVGCPGLEVFDTCGPDLAGCLRTVVMDACSTAEQAEWEAFCREHACGDPVTVRSGLSYTSTEDYIARQARWGDFNSDGVADVAYALYGCWTEPGSGVELAPVASTAYSAVYYGDGTGGFVDAGITLPAPFLGTPDSWTRWPLPSAGPGIAGDRVYDWGEAYRHHWVEWFAAVDIDRSGRVDFLTSTWPTGTGSEDHLFATAATGAFQGALADVGEVVLPGAALSSTQFVAYDQLLADWNGDGFIDVYLHTQAGDGIDDILYLNQRTTSRLHATTIRGPWGGEIELNYTTAARRGSSPDLPWAVEVIESVDDERGHTEYTFDGGIYWGREGRFLGFRDALVETESGRISNYRFGVKPWTQGSLVYRADRRWDDTLETFQYWSSVEPPGGAAVVDNDPPYWNPPRRECTTWVGPGYDAGGGLRAQSVDEADLVRACDNLGGVPEIGWDAYFDLHGWGLDDDEAGELPAATEWQEWDLWSGAIVVQGGGSGPGGSWSPDHDAAQGGYPDLDSDLADAMDPGEPARPVVDGGTTTEWTTYARAWEFDPYQRADVIYDHGDVDVADDDQRTQVEYLPFDLDEAGEAPDWAETFKADDSLGRRVEFGYGTSEFRPPTSVQESDGGTLVRTWAYTYDRGEVTHLVDPDYDDTWHWRNDCGLPTTTEDGTGQATTYAYDAACRVTSRTTDGGAVTTWDYDGLGRVVDEVTTVPGGGAEAMSEHRAYHDGGGPGPRMSVQRGDGSARLLYLDEWGREVRETTCMAPGSAAASFPSTVACEWNTVHTARGYATDGTLRFATLPYDAGDVAVPARWSFRDEAGRVEIQLDPSPAADGDFAETTWTFAPGVTTVENAVGLVCSSIGDTLQTAWWCDGEPRGSRSYDPIAQVLHEYDAEMVEWLTYLDGFGRPQVRQLASAIAVESGTTRLREEWDWAADDKALRHRDPRGSETTYGYDELDREISVVFDPATGPAVTVSQSVYWDGVPNARFTMHTDVNGNATLAFRDGLDRVYARTLADGSMESWTYDSRGRPAVTVDRDGRTFTRTYDARSNVVELDRDGVLVESTSFDDERPVSTTDADGVTTTASYRWNGAPDTVQRLRDGADPWTLSQRTWRADGALLIAQENGVGYSFGYDDLGRRTEACVGTAGGGCGVLFEYGYDGNDRLVEQWRGTLLTGMDYNDAGWLRTVNQPGGGVVSYSYTSLGQVATVIDEAGVLSRWGWDDWGRLASEDLPGQDPRYITYTFDSDAEHHERQVVEEPDGGLWTTWYDGLGRVALAEDAAGVQTSYTYSGTRLTSTEVSDGAGPVEYRGWWYNADGTLRFRSGSMIPAEWSTLPSEPIVGDVHGFAYTYSDAGRVLTRSSVLDTTSWTWVDGVLEEESVAGISTTALDYDDDFPRLIGSTEVSSSTSQVRTLDLSWERGMYVSEQAWTDSATSDTVTTTFDNRDAYGTPRLLRHLVGGTLDHAMVRTTDARGRITAELHTDHLSTTRSLGWTYATNGAVTAMSTSFAGGVTYLRDVEGMLTGVQRTSTGANLATITERDPLGRIAKATLAGGVTVDLERDTRGQTSAMMITAPGKTRDLSWSYDAVGRPSSKVQVDTVGAVVTNTTDSFAYTPEGWLGQEERVTTTGPSMSTKTTWRSYDLDGNRTAENVLTSGGTLVTTNYTYGTGDRLSS